MQKPDGGVRGIVLACITRLEYDLQRPEIWIPAYCTQTHFKAMLEECVVLPKQFHGMSNCKSCTDKKIL